MKIFTQDYTFCPNQITELLVDSTFLFGEKSRKKSKGKKTTTNNLTQLSSSENNSFSCQLRISVQLQGKGTSLACRCLSYFLIDCPL